MKTVSHIIPQDHLVKSKKVVPQPVHFNDYQIRNFFRGECHSSYRELASRYVEFEQKLQYSVQDREHLRAFILKEFKTIVETVNDDVAFESALSKANMSCGYLYRVSGNRELDLVIIAGDMADTLKERIK